MRWEILVPLPPDGCQENTPRHWRVRQQARLLYRTECFYAYKEAQMPKMTSLCFIHLSFYHGPTKDKRYRGRDESNCLSAFKAGMDALSDAGIIIGDTKKYLRLGSVEILGTKSEHKGRAGVLVRLKGEEDGSDEQVGDKKDENSGQAG